MDMEWVRGEIIGKGSFSSVYLGTTRRSEEKEEFPNLMAVKSSLVSQSSSLQHEKEILTQFKDCPQILQCYGDDLSIEKNGEKFYNLFLEFASGGSLSQLMKNSPGGSISETHVRGYTKSILKGIYNIHQKGIVHCDIKLQNILVCCSSDSKTPAPMEVKIADFGLAKKTGEKSESGLWGTPLYMSPESISGKEEIGTASDIWALGCIVSEMITGKPAWRCGSNTDVAALMYRIGFGDELPSIPDEISEQGRDFLSRCFVRDSTKRWSAEMLLNHPFVAHHSVSLPTIVVVKPSTSPRSAFDFPEWSCCSSSPSISSPSSSSSSSSSSVFDDWGSEEDCLYPIDRIRNLVTNNQKPSWSSSDGWITVR